jgi:tetratricopeptide (TPR) repeat protein
MLAGLAAGVILNVFLDIPFAPSFYAALSALTTVYLWGLWNYARLHRLAGSWFKFKWISRTRRVSIILLLSLAALLVIAFGPSRTIEASLVEARIRAALIDGQVNPQESVSLARSLKAASMGVPVDLSRKSRVQLREATLNSGAGLPGLTDLANALTGYNRAMLPPARLNANGTPAERAYLSAAALGGKALANLPAVVDRQAASEALSKFSDVVKLATDKESDLKAEAFVQRAIFENTLKMYSDALTDVKAAEDLGYSDLSALISVEVTARSELGTRADLERLILLVNVGIRIDPPDWLTSIGPGMKRLYREELLRRRAKAFYQLGQFDRAVLDASEVLRTGTPTLGVQTDVIKLLILSELGGGMLDQARQEAKRWVSIRGTPDSQYWYDILSQPLDAHQMQQILGRTPPLR